MSLKTRMFFSYVTSTHYLRLPSQVKYPKKDWTGAKKKEREKYSVIGYGGHM